MSSIAFADIRLEVSDKDARTAFGQIGLNSLEVRTKPFWVGDCARYVLVTLGHYSIGRSC
jgi:hypothetical protein